MHPPTQLPFLFDWFISLISLHPFLPNGQGGGVPSPPKWSSGTRFYLAKDIPISVSSPKHTENVSVVSRWRRYKPTMFNILPSVLWSGNEVLLRRMVLQWAISVGGEFWNTRYYCQIITRDKSIQSSIIQHRDRTLGCTIYLTSVAKAQTMCSNPNIEITPPKRLCQKSPALPYW